MLAAGSALPPDGIVLVEGQGSLCHPASTATLPLIRGTQPTDLVLVHRADQSCIERLPQIPLPPLRELVERTEALAGLARPHGSVASPRVRAVALNTARLSEADARAAIRETEIQLGLPCTDPVRWGAEQLLEAVVQPLT